MEPQAEDPKSYLRDAVTVNVYYPFGCIHDGDWITHSHVWWTGSVVDGPGRFKINTMH